MVRDRVCNTFLPQSRALELEVGGERHYFCSESCRDRFLAELEQR
jgi:YHS domain-containing protein